MSRAKVDKGIWHRYVPNDAGQHGRWRFNISKNVIADPLIRECRFCLQDGPTVLIPVEDLRRAVVGGPENKTRPYWGPNDIKPNEGTVGGHPVRMRVFDTQAEIIEELVATRASRRIADVKIRKAIETRAMKVACDHLAGTWHVVDPSVACNNPFDILCKNPDGDELHVEVKGTQGHRSTVELTIGEVDHAKQWYPRTALVVVWEIEVTSQEDGSVNAEGGHFEVLCPWRPEESKLSPTRFRYSLPRVSLERKCGRAAGGVEGDIPSSRR